MAALLSLGAYLERAAEAPFSWVEGRDCGTFCADWCVAKTGLDPIAPWRGRYQSALGLARITRGAGGFSGAFALGAVLCGFPPTRTPDNGDVALVEAPTGRISRPVGAIRFGARWAFLTSRGVMFSRATPLMAWSVIAWPKPSRISPAQ